MAKKTKSKSSGFKGGTRKVDAFADAWKKAKENPATGGFIDERMTGIFMLNIAEIAEIGDNNWKHVVFDCVCVEPEEYRGQMFHHRCGIESENSLPFLRRDLTKLGCDPDVIEDTEDLLTVLVSLSEQHPYFRASVRQQKDSDFFNMRIAKMVDWTPEEDAAITGDVEPAKGLKVLVTHKGKEIRGVITTVSPKAETCTVKLKGLKGAVVFQYDEITLDE